MHQDTPLFVNKFCKQPCTVSSASVCVAGIQAAVKQAVPRQALMAGASISNPASIRKSPVTPIFLIQANNPIRWPGRGSLPGYERPRDGFPRLSVDFENVKSCRKIESFFAFCAGLEGGHD